MVRLVVNVCFSFRLKFELGCFYMFDCQKNIIEYVDVLQ